MELSIYLSSYDPCHEWAGKWFEINSKEDIKKAMDVCYQNGIEEIETCDYEGDFDYYTLGGRNMIYYLNRYFDELEEIFKTISDPFLRNYFLKSYNPEDVISNFENSTIHKIKKEGYSEDYYKEVGYYFSDTIDFSSYPDIFSRYFDYEGFGRDIVYEGYYTILEDKKYIYLVE